MFIISIDVGIENFALIEAICDSEFNIQHIYEPLHIDLRMLLSGCDCEYHSREVPDYMYHLFKKYKTQFTRASYILVERQPLTGITSVEDIIYWNYRNKTIKSSPNELHAYFNINEYDYDTRKKFVEKYSYSVLSKYESYVKDERKHDMADAYCILVYFLVKQKEKLRKERIDEQIKENERQYQLINKDTIRLFESYKYTGF